MARANSVVLRIGNDYILQSYGKTVAAIIGGVAFVAQERYSVTTSRHVSQFLRNHASVQTRTVPQRELDELGLKIGGVSNV